MNKFTDKLVEVGNKLASQKHLRSISSGLMAIMPLTMLGSIFQLIAALPDIFPFIPAFSEAVSNAILFPYNMAFGLFGVIAVVSIAYYHARYYNMDVLQAPIVALIAFIMIAAPITDSTLDATYIGSQGIFLAIFVALITVEAMRFLLNHNVKINLPDSIPPFVASTFEAIIPMVIIVSGFYGLSLICQYFTGQLIPAWFMGIISPAIEGSESLWFCMLMAFIIAFLQFLGVHGFNAVSGIILPLLIANTAENAAAYAAGETATKIFTLPMFQMSGVFCYIIPILFLMCKSERLKSMGKISIVPAVFGIAEPIQYGAPIMFNPILGIPWIVMYTVNMGVVWCAMNFGLVSKAIIAASSNIPMPIFQYLCTLDFRAVILFVVMFIISAIIWIPFVKVYDKQCLAEEEETKKVKEAEAA